jgi:anti-sigma B factor antagonist
MKEVEAELQEKAERYAARHGDSSIRLACTARPPRLIVSLSGVLDTASSTDFHEFLRAAKETAAMSGGLAVDLSGIHYVSSTGIGILSSAMIDYTKDRIPFALRCVPEKVQEIFKMLGLWTYFSIDSDQTSCEN